MKTRNRKKTSCPALSGGAGLVAAAGLILFVFAMEAAVVEPVAPGGQVAAHKAGKSPVFQSSERCVACHNGLSTPSGEDVSIGFNWRATMMANAARDPYWQAGVRREIIDHPMAQAKIEDECSTCHMPMARYEAKLAGHDGVIFGHLPFNPKKRDDRLAADGVSCSLCHQMTSDKWGTRESFVGGFVIGTPKAGEPRPVYGPYEIDNGHTTIMRTSAGFKPSEGKHVKKSEMCATCHTLLTQALDSTGKVIGELPEQVPYQEWLESGYKETKSCQSCHMPAVEEKVPITAILGEPREDFARHTFVGGNFFMQRILGKFRGDLAVAALPNEMEAAANRTIAHLEAEAARVAIERVSVEGDRLAADVSVENLSGHKLPTAYPSRRVWLHVTVRDARKNVLFESGALQPDGKIAGNDADLDASCFEPHYSEINSPDQVQIYESVMGDAAGKPTTGLLTALRFIKDNRLLPKGFDKMKAAHEVAVIGEALADPNFTAGGDRVRYSVALKGATGPFTIEAELWYQPVGYRWAMNLKKYDAFEPKRFVGYYEATAAGSGVMLARAAASR